MTDQPIVLGIGGLLRSGKDAFADGLVNEKFPFVRMGMSDPLNEVLLVLNPVIDIKRRWFRKTEVRYADLIKQLGYVEAKKHPEVRRLLQYMGTEVGRKMIDEDIWVQVAEKNIKTHTDAGRSVALTGIRFPNEIRMVQRIPHAYSVWVERPGVVSTGDHASENSVKKEDFTILIHNDSTLEDLHATAKELVSHIG